MSDIEQIHLLFNGAGVPVEGYEDPADALDESERINSGIRARHPEMKGSPYKVKSLPFVRRKS